MSQSVEIDPQRREYGSSTGVADSPDPVSAHRASSATARRAPEPRPVSAKARCQHPMVDDANRARVGVAADLARATWEPMNLYPGDIADILPTIDAIEQWASDNHAPTLGDLEADKMLRAITGAASLTSKTHRDQLHMVRNTLTALRGTVLFNMGASGRRRSDRPGRDSLDRDLPELPKRFNSRRRPMTDDETLLGNILVEVDLLEEAPIVPINAYLVAAAGVHTMESTELTTEHLNDRNKPTSISAKGLWEWAPDRRDVRLDEFTSHALSRTLARSAAGVQRLTYSGTRPATEQACASLSPVISRFLRRAGVADTDVTPRSLTVARAYRIIRHTANFKAAKAVHGGKTANLLVDIKCTLDEETLAMKKVRVIDHAGRKVAKVKARHIPDIKRPGPPAADSRTGLARHWPSRPIPGEPPSVAAGTCVDADKAHQTPPSCRGNPPGRRPSPIAAALLTQPSLPAASLRHLADRVATSALRDVDGAGPVGGVAR